MEKGSIGMGVKNPSIDSDITLGESGKVSLAGIDNKGYILTSVQDVINWSRTGSLYWMTFGLSSSRMCGSVPF